MKPTNALQCASYAYAQWTEENGTAGQCLAKAAGVIDDFVTSQTSELQAENARLREALQKVRGFLHDRHVVYVDETDLWDAKETIDAALNSKEGT